MRYTLEDIHGEHLFVLGGLLMIFSALAVHLLASVRALGGGGEGGHGDLALNLLANFVPAGIAFVGWGFGWHHRALILKRRSAALPLIVAFLLLLLDGTVHLFALSEHLDEPLHASFFGVVGPLQFLGAFTLPRASRRALALWLLMTLGLVALYMVSRTTTLVGDIEPVEGLGLVSKGGEVVLVLTLISLLRHASMAGEPAPNPAVAE